MDEQNIAIVNQNDEIIAYQDKLKVHEKGILHRAFSIFIFNEKNEILLQQRAFSKYHSPGLWTNSCCSHAIEGEEFSQTIHSRLIEEMGMDCDLHFKFSFHYHFKFENGLIENEIDHVYFGNCSVNPNPNSDEVNDYRWASISEIRHQIESNPENFTYWFKFIFERVAMLVQ